MSRFTQQDMHDELLWEKTYEAIRNEADAILASEGEHYVRGQYFASTDNATTARMVEAEQRVRVRGRQAIEVEVKKALMVKQIHDLFERSPECTVCKKPIASLGEASVFTPINGHDQLVHSTDECFAEMLALSIGRYAGKGRGVAIKQAAS